MTGASDSTRHQPAGLRHGIRCALLLLVGLVLPGAAAQNQPPRMAGSVAWTNSRDLNLLGVFEADLPLAALKSGDLYIAPWTRTAIEKSTGDWSFKVRELDYRVGAGWRRPLGNGWFWSLFIEQRGFERVDARGRSAIRVLGSAWATPGFRGDLRPGRFEGRIALGHVISRIAAELDQQVEFDGSLTLHSGHHALFLDGRWTGWRGERGWSKEWSFGPRLDLGWDGTRRAALFVRWQRADHPLGLPLNGVSVGLDLLTGPALAGGAPETLDPEDPLPYRVLLSGGGGEGRRAGRLAAQFTAPQFENGRQLVFDLDVNTLTARDTGELYFLLEGGLENCVALHCSGFFFFHRSNHQLATPGDRVTSNNVILWGRESSNWRSGDPGLRPEESGFDYRVRGGYVLQSSFGDGRRWHLSGGLRWSGREAWYGGRLFWGVEATEGDVHRRIWSAGWRHRRGLDLRLEHRRDSQFYGRDESALLFLAGWVL